MDKPLIEYITDLNETIEKIKQNKDYDVELLIILPLVEFMRNHNFMNRSKIDKILTKNLLNIKKLKFYKFSDYINVSDKIENYLSKFTDDIKEQFPNEIDTQSIDFLLYELLINIYKHSKFKNAYLQIKKEDNNKNINICIFDNGIGIPNSFKENLINFPNDCEALYESINGKTTDKEKYNLHGRGLNSAGRITALGFEGEMLIASGKGICTITKEGAKTYFNHNPIYGTFIILRIPYKKIDNIYEYLKYKKINRITEELL